jgi:hypothetical protein
VARYHQHDDQRALEKYREAPALDSSRTCEACSPVMQAAE